MGAASQGGAARRFHRSGGRRHAREGKGHCSSGGRRACCCLEGRAVSLAGGEEAAWPVHWCSNTAQKPACTLHGTSDQHARGTTARVVHVHPQPSNLYITAGDWEVGAGRRDDCKCRQTHIYLILRFVNTTDHTYLI